MIAISDSDMFKYSAAYAGEVRSVIVEHPNGFCREFKSRTEFHGRGANKDGGELAKLNKKGSTYLAEDFTYTDVQIAEPLEEVLRSTKNTIDAAVRASGAKEAIHFLGEGESFRVERSTLIRYKGERGSQIKPLLLDEVTEFIKHHYKAEVVSHIECDDIVVQECYKRPDRFVLCEDKDARSQPVKVFDVNFPQDGVIDCTGFGGLFICNRNKTPQVRGFGYLHLYYQMLAGDAVDNIKPSCFSDMKLGSMGAYKLLKDCKTHKEAFQVMKDTYIKMYPEPRVVIGWRGEPIMIDWRYVFNEVFDLVRMHRFDNDFVVGTDVLDNLLK